MFYVVPIYVPATHIQFQLWHNLPPSLQLHSALWLAALPLTQGATIVMAIAHAYQQGIKQFIVFGLIVLLTACGGGGGKGATEPDTTPNTFTLTAITGAAVNTDVTSAAVTIAGINGAAPISITGGSYSINDAAFITTASTVSSGQSVKVKVATSVTTNTPKTATLTIGGVSGTFTVTTVADTTPTDFTFIAVTGAALSSVNTSNAITVGSIDIPVAISISGGEYRIDNGAFTNAPGTVGPNQTVNVKLTASDHDNTPVSAVLTIGGVTGTYTVTTLKDTAAPTAQILFPPSVSMTEANTIIVRGTAQDDHSTIKNVKVNGVLATSTDGFANWQATVPLTSATDNNLIVSTEDNATETNSAANVAQVMIRQAPITSAFPDADNQFDDLREMVIDRFDGRNRLLVADNTSIIKSVDLTTGKRTLFGNYDSAGSPSISYFSLNPLNKHLYAVGSDILIDIDLANSTQYQSYTPILYSSVTAIAFDVNATKLVSTDYSGVMVSTTSPFANFEVFSDAAQNIPDGLNPFLRAYSLSFDKNNSRYLVSDGNVNAIVAVNSSTGARSVLSSNSIGAGDAFSAVNVGFIRCLQVDDIKHRAIVIENKSGKIFSVDLATGNRTLITQITIGANPSKAIQGMVIDNVSNNIFVSDSRLNGVIVVDLVTGQQVVFSK